MDGTPTGVLLGMGNPLLDISAQVDQELLDQFEVRGQPPRGACKESERMQDARSER